MLMKVLSIFFHPGVNFTALGGAERRFFEVMKVWIKKGVRVTVIDSNPDLLTEEMENLEVIDLPAPFHYRGMNLLLMYFEWVSWALKACLLCPSILRKGGFNVILSPNNTLPTLLVAYFMHLTSRLPLCIIVHHMDFPFQNKRVSFRSVYYLYRKAQYNGLISFIKTVAFFCMLGIIRRSNVCIAVSNFTAEFLVANGVFGNKVFVSGNGVNVDYIDSFEVKGKMFDGIFVGRIARDKGIFDLVKAWERVVERKKESKLVIVGSGPDFVKLKKIVEKERLERNIVIKGRCDDEVMYSLMKASRVFILPSMFEGWGITLAEALACGLPVICYDIPALCEVFGECDSVFFVKMGNVNMLTEAIFRVLDHGDLDSFTRISRDFVKRFSWENVAFNDLRIIGKMVL